MITIIDYGMGNLRSVSKAVEHLGGRCRFAGKGSDLRNAKRIILPGVGAFGNAMQELKKRCLVLPLMEALEKGTKLLGVCLGLQLFFESSEEAPGIKGLGLFPGKVLRFRSKKAKIPHMGWNDLVAVKKHPLLNGIRAGDYFYFLHSYYGKPGIKDLTLASCRYAGRDFAAVVGNSRIAATQFHPEKSQDAGLRILSNFLKW
ncbi:MAG TPA: imidazole glycerol phosphate synthase subunit HisH [Candidatus Omnitrophota bacterium]|jgi:glutamine amidotransferase|nr:imidazole glycerol phosphate synthase subunit HisH [Candidatus Omnitrophota bacterium]HQB94955.1 imidazole glycerol phosphate synthase subunit HisH [Candidatus Omnitrophota bacterium]